MSNKKLDRGKLFYMLHQLQKKATQLLKRGKTDEVKIIEVREHKLIEKIKGKNKKS